MPLTSSVDSVGKPSEAPPPKRRGWRSASATGTKRGYIYFAMTEDHVKIGFATDVANRLPCLQTGNHQVIVMEEYFASYIEAETLIHERFAADRVLNEWFNATPEIDELIEDIFEHQLFNAEGEDARAALRNRHDVFFELDTVKELLANF